jgi:hypothetical protein
LLSQGEIRELIGVAKIVRGAAESGVLARKRWLVVGSRSAGLKSRR